ncbi:hypothetical protein MNBD_DELTA01-233 [hydrothermal vent metagenome]|uniref:Transposase IS200-like domain-containing protein n=1 Tax=hydrothermal vent metagenome TaxID=652676 RepID=A0A3B0QQC9_9ZZZZ
MSSYVRSREGKTYFFTVVTYKRQLIFDLDSSVNIFNKVVKEVQLRYSFEIKAMVIMPDHIHAIWELPSGDFNYSMRWGLIKKEFTKRITTVVSQSPITKSRSGRREGSIWQRRFWEHTIRDDKDYEAHVDYIHYNPVKHGLVNDPKDWVNSTFRRYLDDGIYQDGWGSHELEFSDGVGGE